MEMLNIMDLFEEVEIKNNNRLSKEDQEIVNQFDNTLKTMQEQFKKYLKFYEENKIYNMERDYNSEERTYIQKEIRISIYSIEEKFVESVVFKEINSLISNIYNYFRNKYNVSIEYEKHNSDYSLQYKKIQSQANLQWFLNISIDEIMNDIFEQMGGFEFDDKALNECIERVKKTTKQYRQDTKKITVKGCKISIVNFTYFDNWYVVNYGEYDNKRIDNVIDLFKLIGYFNNGEFENNYTVITNSMGRNNKFVGVYEIDDEILKSVKTFKNGKFELNFKSSVKALEFARKYLNYME